MAELKLCPNLGCNNTGCFPVQISEDDWELVQCEFCYTEPDSVFNALCAARVEGYTRALDDFAMLLEHDVRDYKDTELRAMINQLKEKGKTE
jgi:hypothetical protein